jgi:hypothetical protein
LLPLRTGISKIVTRLLRQLLQHDTKLLLVTEKIVTVTYTNQSETM